MGQPWGGSQCHLPPVRACVSVGPVQHTAGQHQVSIAAGCHSSPKQLLSCVCSDTGHTQMSRGSGLDTGKALWQEQAQHTLLTQPQTQAPDGERLNLQGVISFLSMEKILSWDEISSCYGGREGNAPASPLSPQSAFVPLIPGQAPTPQRWLCTRCCPEKKLPQ